MLVTTSSAHTFKCYTLRDMLERVFGVHIIMPRGYDAIRKCKMRPEFPLCLI